MKTTIKIKDFISAIDYQIGEGYEYGWACYGENACGLDWERNDISASAAIIYDKKTQEVFEVAVWDYLGEETKPYRWIKHEYIRKHKNESISRGFKFNIAVDKVKFIEITPAKILGHLKRLHKRNTASSVKKPKKT